MCCRPFCPLADGKRSKKPSRISTRRLSGPRWIRFFRPGKIYIVGIRLRAAGLFSGLLSEPDV